MKNKKITGKISQGVYVLTTACGGCIVDAVSQISAGDNPLISVAVSKQNYTNELLHKNDAFALSVLGEDADPNIIETFGMKSMRDIDKFAQIETVEVSGLAIVPSSVGYMICEIIDTIENDTHTLFIGRMIEGDIFKEGSAMTYAYYREHKEDLQKVTTTSGNTAWVCTICGYVYYGENLPDDFVCPLCGVEKELFKKQN